MGGGEEKEGGVMGSMTKLICADFAISYSTGCPIFLTYVRRIY